MKIQSLFKDDIHRQIDGVIKADDDSNLIQEVSEYVITNEISSKLGNLFEAYNDYRHNNTGVWVSGFFGCGKSHLLKMLSLLLEDRKVNGTRLVDLFIPKIEDEMLKAQFKKAVAIPSKSILFNIDQNADQIGGGGEDDILSVFLKVFNGMLGYYENSPYIAEFEAHLDEDGLLGAFKEAYLKETGESWETGRETAHLLDNEEFAIVLSKVKKMSEEEALKTLDRYEKSFQLSIKSFCQRVKKYLSKQPKDFRLNFYVDEVGQYIAGKGDLMLNLQTLAETLTTVCEGRAWIMVTSQSDMEAIIGDMDSSQSNDFSKIIGRFPTKINLTSADVAEVIQRRLLTKTDSSTPEFNKLYEQESNNIKTIFQFGDNSRTYKSYKDEEHFRYCYPFLPYQFDLFQNAIHQLSRHNAFEGKHRSVGERSMLSVFQEVLKKLSDLEMGQVATFDMMFEGLKQALKGESLKSINQADRQLSDPFHKRVLKALFLVKFENSFKATKRNISILLIDSFKTDLKAHGNKVQEALNRLELESYIQRVGDIYEFLTDTEKDIENEIKDTDIESTAVGDLLKEIIFQDILRDSKVRFEDNGYDYPFTRKIDDNAMGKEQELGINIITQLNDRHGDEGSIINMFRNPDEMLVVLPADSTLVDDLRIYKKTEKYVMINNSQQMRDEKKNIIQAKASANRNRHAGLVDKLSELLTQARFFVNGNLTVVTGTDPKARVHKAFQELIRQSYPHLKMLKKTYQETFLKEILLSQVDDAMRPESSGLNEAQKEVLNVIQREKNKGSRSTVKSLLEVFEKKPYGWYQNAVLCLVAELFENNKIEVRQDSNPLSSRELYNNLINSRTFGNTIIEPQQEFSEKQISDLKNFHRELFDLNNTGTDAKTVAENFRAALEEERQDLEKLLEHKARYGFLDKLSPFLSQLKTLIGKEYGYYLSELKSFDNNLLDEKEEHVDKIKKFWNGEMKKIYDEAIRFLDQSRANFDYLKGHEVDSLCSLEGFGQPYQGNAMQNIKQALDQVRQQEKDKIKEHRERVCAEVLGMIESLKTDECYAKLASNQQQELVKPIEALLVKTDAEPLIPVILTYVQSARGLQATALEKALSLSMPKVKPGGGSGDGPSPDRSIEPVVVSAHEARPHYGKAMLSTEQDVDDYLGKLRQKYMELIKANKRIQI